MHSTSVFCNLLLSSRFKVLLKLLNTSVTCGRHLLENFNLNKWIIYNGIMYKCPVKILHLYSCKGAPGTLMVVTWDISKQPQPAFFPDAVFGPRVMAVMATCFSFLHFPLFRLVY